MRRGHASATAARRFQAVERALDLLYAIARRESVFSIYDGHLLLAFALIATTSRRASLKRRAMAMGRERADHWAMRWPSTRTELNPDTALQQVIALDAASRLGLGFRHVTRDLRAVIRRSSIPSLLYFDPTIDDPPGDIPDECRCGRSNPRGQRVCAACGRRLRLLSPYTVWYYALTSAYFCERQEMELGVTPGDLLQCLPRLRPYPAAGARHHFDAIYAVTHTVYVLNDYGNLRLRSRALRAERAFLGASLPAALQRREADTVGEIVDSLLALGMADTHRLIRAARAFLLDTQRADGGWGAEGGDYGRFHTIWTAIDGLRDHAWRTTRSLITRRAFAGVQAVAR